MVAAIVVYTGYTQLDIESARLMENLRGHRQGWKSCVSSGVGTRTFGCCRIIIVCRNFCILRRSSVLVCTFDFYYGAEGDVHD